MMKNYDQSVEINHNLNWPYILDHLYRILIIGNSGSAKTNVLVNLIKNQDKILTKFISTSKIRLNWINGREKVGIKKLKNPKH